MRGFCAKHNRMFGLDNKLEEWQSRQPISKATEKPTQLKTSMNTTKGEKEYK